MKVHIGVDGRHGLTHRASIAPANVHDSRELPNLLHGNEARLYGDSAYTVQKDVLKEIAPNAKDFTSKRASRSRPLKSIFGFAKARYRGLVKNANRAFALLVLIDIDKWGLSLTGQVRPA